MAIGNLTQLLHVLISGCPLKRILASCTWVPGGPSVTGAGGTTADGMLWVDV